MKASALYAAVKNDMEMLSTYKSHIEQKLRDEDVGSIRPIMARYDHDAVVEILVGSPQCQMR